MILKPIKTKIYVINLERFEIKDNMILCIRPEQVPQFHASGDILGYRNSFTESFF